MFGANYAEEGENLEGSGHEEVEISRSWRIVAEISEGASTRQKS